MSVAHASNLRSLRFADIDVLVRDGEPSRTVFLLHGIGGRASSFAELMLRWPPGRRLVAWDMPGYGASSYTWENTSYETTHYAGRMLDLHNALFPSFASRLQCSVDIVGQSLGALIAGPFCETFVGIAGRLVLMSPALGYKTPAGARLPETLAKRIHEFQSEGPENFAAKRAPRLVYKPQSKPKIVEKVRSTMATLTSAGHALAVRALAEGDLESNVWDISRPTLILSGSEDVVTPLQGSTLLFDTVKRRPWKNTIDQMHVVPNAGHAVYLEAPDEVARVVHGFLELHE